EVYKDASSQVHTLRRMVKEKDEAIQKQSNLEKKIHELEKQGTIKIQKKADGDIAILTSPPQGNGHLPETQGVVGVSGEGMVSHIGVANGAAHGMTISDPPQPPLPPPMPAT
ncbi:hypothetical protein M9458_019263, partial [Cirrhinus mrigala]